MDMVDIFISRTFLAQFDLVFGGAFVNEESVSGPSIRQHGWPQHGHRPILSLLHVESKPSFRVPIPGTLGSQDCANCDIAQTALPIFVLNSTPSENTHTHTHTHTQTHTTQCAGFQITSMEKCISKWKLRLVLG